MTFTKENKLAEIVINNQKAAMIFENYNIDYSNAGDKKISEICKFNSEELLEKINKLNGSAINKLNDWSPDFLCDYIVSNHHIYIKKTFPVLISRIKSLTRNKKIEKKTSDALMQLHSDFEIHMNKEEKLIFPYIKKLVKTDIEKRTFEIEPFGSVSELIKVMLKEHLNAYEQLKNIIADINRSVKGHSDEIEINEFLKLFREFETDFHFHIHIENNILFPKSIILERKLKRKNSINNLKLKNKNQTK